MKYLIAVILASLVAALAAGTAGAYDRQPIALGGLYPDSWGQSTGSAQRQLMNRYPGIRSSYCIGVLMKGHYSDSSWLDDAGLTRFWDKLMCFGFTTRSGTLFALIFDAKGPHSFIIYRLRNTTVNALYG